MMSQMTRPADSDPRPLAWVLDAPSDWTCPVGLGLVGQEQIESVDTVRGKRRLYRTWAPADGANLRELCERFGRGDDAARALWWTWWSEETYPNEPELPESVALVSMALGARVPLVRVPSLMGVALTREGLAALGFVSATVPGAPAEPPAEILDAPEVARLYGIKLATLYKRARENRNYQAALVPGLGRRMQFVRSKLPGLGGK